MMDEKKRGPKPGYWVRFVIEECVLCGRQYKYKEYIYDMPKPDDPNERYVYDQSACGEHFVYG